jgi:hypothetical protein
MEKVWKEPRGCIDPRSERHCAADKGLVDEKSDDGTVINNLSNEPS